MSSKRKIPATRDRPYGTQLSEVWAYSSRARTRRAWGREERKRQSVKESRGNRYEIVPEQKLLSEMNTDKKHEHGGDKVGQEKEEKKEIKSVQFRKYHRFR